MLACVRGGKAAKGHEIYLYLLRGLRVGRHTQKVLAWRISNTLEAEFCVYALNEAIHKFGPPEIMNSDSHMMFTSSRVVSLKH